MSQFLSELGAVGGTLLRMLPYLAAYVAVILSLMLLWRGVRRLAGPADDMTSRKTVTFGDEGAVRSSTPASVASVTLIFLLWAAFTGSSLIPSFLRAPGPFTGDAGFTYTISNPDGRSGTAEVAVRVLPRGQSGEAPQVAPGEGLARNDAVAVNAYRSALVRVDENDAVGRDDGFEVTAIDGRPIEAGGTVRTDWGQVTLSGRGTPNVVPATGLQMEPIWLPAPETVWAQAVQIATEGYRNATLWTHLGYSLFRVILGFLLGAAVGIPLGYAMGLSDWFRGWFDPIVEFMRPVPPLALIPLVIIWAGIGEVGKIILLFLAALWIMAISARSGVSGVAIAKVHAAYSLGASRWQVLRHVIVPNSLPEIFTGARVAMGVCWGTVVAAELVAAEQGAGMMIMVASKFQATDIVIMGIVMIGIVGFAIDMAMRQAERWLVPWKGKV